MSVSELAKTLNVSEVTIRHDLTLLEKQSYLRRQHGAAVPLDNDNVETRMLSNFSQKHDIAEFASTLVAPGETVLKTEAAMPYWRVFWPRPKQRPLSLSVAILRIC